MWIQTLSMAVTAIATVVMAYVYWKLLNLTGQSVEAMRASADEMRRSSEEMRRSTRALERYVVAFVLVHIVEGSDRGAKFVNALRQVDPELHESLARYR